MSTIPTEELQAIASFLLSNNLKTVSELKEALNLLTVLREKDTERRAILAHNARLYYQRKREKVIAEKTAYYFKKKDERRATTA